MNLDYKIQLIPSILIVPCMFTINLFNPMQIQYEYFDCNQERNKYSPK